MDIPLGEGARSWALLRRFHAALIGCDSATLLLRQWGEAHWPDQAGPVLARPLGGNPRAAPPLVPRSLGAGALAFRHVALWCGERLVARAAHWYRPDLLTDAMNRALLETDTPFGAVVTAMGFRRRTLETRALFEEGTKIPAEVIFHQAVLESREGRAFSLVEEHFTDRILPDR